MKKLLAGLAAAVIASFGLVVAAPVTHAAPPNALCQQYQDICTRTETKANGRKQYRKDGKANPKVNVKVKKETPTNGKPEGTIRITVTKPNGAVVTADYAYDGPGNYAVPGIGGVGDYKVVVQFIAAEGSPFRDSRDSYTLTVKPKQKKGRG